jgi:hypothetical protein
MRTAALFALTLTAFRPAGASATTTTVTTTVTTTTSTTLPPTPVTAVCPLAQNPCLVTTAVTINDRSILNFGQRAVVVTPQGSLNIGSGFVTILAGSLDIQPKGAIVGGNGWIMVTTTGPILVEKGTGTRPSKGVIDVSSSQGGGEIDLTAGDTAHAANITIAGILNANGTGNPNADGGTINVMTNNGTVTVTSDPGDVSVASGNLASGGTIDLESPVGSIQVTNLLDASGGDFDGGEIDMNAHADIAFGALNVSASATGNGGVVNITADGNIVASGPISGQGSGTGGNGGDGACVCVMATGSLQVNGAILTASGDGGTGGCLDIEATNGSLVLAAPIDAHGVGSGGCGGYVTFVSGTDTTMTPAMTLMDLSGGPQCGGGTLDESAGGTINVSGEINADHDSGLLGIVAPTIVVNAGANLHASVGPTENGGEVNLFGHDALTLAAGAQLSAAGPGGLNLFQTCGTMNVQAKVSAVAGVPTPLGQNEVQYWQTVPLVNAANFTPAPVITGALAACAPPATTTTATVALSTSTSSTTHIGVTSTSTSTSVTSSTHLAATSTSTSVTSTIPGTPSTTVASTSTSTTIPARPECASDADCDASSSCGHCVASACTSSDAGLPAVTCRLTDLTNALHTAAAPEIRSAALKRKLTAQVGQAVKLVGKAKGKHPRGFLKKARAQLALFSKLVRKNLNHSIDPMWGNHLASLADTAVGQLVSLASAARR